jgi:hypothetical protein
MRGPTVFGLYRTLWLPGENRQIKNHGVRTPASSRAGKRGHYDAGENINEDSNYAN